MDKDLRFAYVSERHQDVVGVPPEAVIGKTRWDVHQRLQSKARVPMTLTIDGSLVI